MILLWAVAAIGSCYAMVNGWAALGRARWFFAGQSALFLALFVLAGVDNMRSEALEDTCVPTWIQTADARGRIDVQEAESCVTRHWLPAELRWINR